MLLPLMVTVCVIVGHCGWWLFCYNRVNATGLPRKLAKFIEKSFLAACALIPLPITWFEGLALANWLATGSRLWPNDAPMFHYWGAWCLACFFVLGTLWLNSRRSLIAPPAFLSERVSHHSVERQLSTELLGRRISRLMSYVPGNEITKLAVTEKSLRIQRTVPGAHGLRIGHLSDLHFTGQLTPEYYQFVLERFLLCSPDLICVTGDIIDHDHCLDWLESLLGQLRAPLGCYFLMGNHEKRLGDWNEVPKRLCGMGWHDMGANDALVNLCDRDPPLRIWITGNEQPWFNRRSAKSQSHVAQAVDSNTLRLGMSHSPDQFPWARRLKLDLLLAGHTHGGQVRLPGIGPLVAPSWHGSRFASGVFHLPPTVMHVSRGLAGVHPIRWRCAPEVSVLTIHSALFSGVHQSEDEISQLQNGLQSRSHIG